MAWAEPEALETLKPSKLEDCRARSEKGNFKWTREMASGVEVRKSEEGGAEAFGV